MCRKSLFDPNHSGYSDLNASFSVNGKIKEGDYFTVKYPQRVTVNGDVNYEKLNNQMKVAINKCQWRCGS